MDPRASRPDRRALLVGASCLLAAPAVAQAPSPFAALEQRAGGRLGVYAARTGGGSVGYRENERFAMASTFKLLLAGVVLARVDRGEERLDRTLPVREADLLDVSPVTRAAAAQGRISIERLISAVIEESDNTGANMLLATLGGPAGFTVRLRAMGDPVTRLDRTETALNSAEAGDPRDTTSPAAMAASASKLIFGDALSPSSRNRLATAMVNCRTGLSLTRAGIPAGWRAGDKTGRGGNGTINDVAALWPPSGPPIVMAVYLTQARLTGAPREAVIADAARAALAALGEAA